MVSNDAGETKMEMDNCTYADHGYYPAKIIENLGAAPLKSALKRQSSCVQHSAKSVTFSSETAKQSSTGDYEDFEECKFTNDQLEVMKQAVTLMGDLPEDIVQLAIDAYNLLQENQFFFSNSGELCQNADGLAQNLLRQGDIRERVNYVKQQLEEESAAKKKDLAYTHDKTPCNNDNETGNNDNDNKDDDDDRKNDSENSGAPKDVTSFGDSGCPAPLAGMSEDGQHSSSSTTTSSSSSSSSKTSDESSASLPTPSPSNMPTVLVQTAAFLSLFHHPTPSSIVAPSSSSCSDSSSLSASPNFAEVAYASSGCPSSGMSGAAHDDRSGQPLATEENEDTSLEPNVTEDAENVPMSAKYVTKNAENVTKSAAELATSAQSLTEMREGSATSSSMTSAAPRHDHKHTHRLQALATENRRLKERKFCRACRKVDLAESGITFLPCGHFITCETCSEMFDDCPACGKNIMGTVRTFLS